VFVDIAHKRLGDFEVKCGGLSVNNLNKNMLNGF
jgi:hypothetical protein